MICAPNVAMYSTEQHDRAHLHEVQHARHVWKVVCLHQRASCHVGESWQTGRHGLVAAGARFHRQRGQASRSGARTYRIHSRKYRLSSLYRGSSTKRMQTHLKVSCTSASWCFLSILASLKQIQNFKQCPKLPYSDSSLRMLQRPCVMAVQELS